MFTLSIEQQWCKLGAMQDTAFESSLRKQQCCPPYLRMPSVCLVTLPGWQTCIHVTLCSRWRWLMMIYSDGCYIEQHTQHSAIATRTHVVRVEERCSELGHPRPIQYGLTATAIAIFASPVVVTFPKGFVCIAVQCSPGKTPYMFTYKNTYAAASALRAQVCVKYM